MKRALLLLALASPAVAQELDLSRGGPITVDARDGFEWRENERIVIATGDARAARGSSTVVADKLTAFYRKKAAQTAAAAANTEGGNEIYRLVADGHVHIFTQTDEAIGDHAVYDIDQAVLVLTGGKLSMTTPQQLITARDSLEYWSDKHMSVARGNAVVITADARRLAGDVLVGYSDPDPADAAKPVKAANMPAGSGNLKRIEAYGNVEVRTATDIVRGARGVYVTATQIARVVDSVRITHGDSQMNGAAADINMATGIAHLVSPPRGRVQGLIVPNSGKTPPGNKP